MKMLVTMTLEKRVYLYRIWTAVVALVALPDTLPADNTDHWGLADVTANVGFLVQIPLKSRLSYAINESCTAQLKVEKFRVTVIQLQPDSGVVRAT